MNNIVDPYYMGCSPLQRQKMTGVDVGIFLFGWGWRWGVMRGRVAVNPFRRAHEPCSYFDTRCSVFVSAFTISSRLMSVATCTS